MKKLILVTVIILPFLGIGCASTPKARSIQSLGDKGVRVEIDLSASKGESILGRKVGAYRSVCRDTLRRGNEVSVCKKEPLAEGTVVEAAANSPVVVEFLGRAAIDSNTEFELK